MNSWQTPRPSQSFAHNFYRTFTLFEFLLEHQVKTADLHNMADIAEDTKVMANGSSEQEQAEVAANGEKSTDTAPPEESIEAPKADDEPAKNHTTEATSDKTVKNVEDAAKGEGANENEIPASTSPEPKRKEAPVSAHERGGRKRSRGGSRYNTNIKTRFEDLPESSDADEIRRQIEFYFSDSNLPIDAYLLDQTGKN